jgi:uncharacterized YccA/Bax inhibitor family protein
LETLVILIIKLLFSLLDPLVLVPAAVLGWRVLNLRIALSYALMTGLFASALTAMLGFASASGVFMKIPASLLVCFVVYKARAGYLSRKQSRDQEAA